jgi:hypothetical protein
MFLAKNATAKNFSPNRTNSLDESFSDEEFSDEECSDKDLQRRILREPYFWSLGLESLDP